MCECVYMCVNVCVYMCVNVCVLYVCVCVHIAAARKWPQLTF